MPRLEIKVIKTSVFEDLASYAASPQKPCHVFKEGQVFTTDYEKPSGFCDWAWNDLHPYVSALLAGGNFAEGMYKGWMKDPDVVTACCTDGLRPVVFEIRRVGD